MQSQSVKKAQKNQARLPRTAGLRTLSELTTSLKKAGYDPSSIQQRAEMLAKMQGAKRSRAEAEMDVDSEGESGGEEDWMDVDGDETPNKRVKGNSGAVVAKSSRAPRTNRQLAGLRDEQVMSKAFLFCFGASYPPIYSRYQKPSNCGILAKEAVICSQKLVKVIAPSGSKWWVIIWECFAKSN